MAASYSSIYSRSCFCYGNIPKSSVGSSTLARPLFPYYNSNLSSSKFNVISYTKLHQQQSRVFSNSQDQQQEEQEAEEDEEEKQEEEEEDSCLPSDLEGAVRQSGQASAVFVNSGGLRAIVCEFQISRNVELLIPQLQFLDDEGAQAELWDLSRLYLETLIEETGCQRVKAVFPDAGAAALLKYRWQNATFGFASLSDRKPVSNEDEIVVMVVPDYQMLEYVERIASSLSDDPPRPLIMWNPRLISEDVGVGFNVRKLRRYFLRTFTTVYSMRPLPSGAVFRSYPGSWKVFFDDKVRPNRYLLAKELVGRPDAEDLQIIFGSGEEKEEGPSFFDKAASIFSSMNRFMKVISR